MAASPGNGWHEFTLLRLFVCPLPPPRNGFVSDESYRGPRTPETLREGIEGQGQRRGGDGKKTIKTFGVRLLVSKWALGSLRSGDFLPSTCTVSLVTRVERETNGFLPTADEGRAIVVRARAGAGGGGNKRARSRRRFGNRIVPVAVLRWRAAASWLSKSRARRHVCRSRDGPAAAPSPRRSPPPPPPLRPIRLRVGRLASAAGRKTRRVHRRGGLELSARTGGRRKRRVRISRVVRRPQTVPTRSFTRSDEHPFSPFFRVPSPFFRARVPRDRNGVAARRRPSHDGVRVRMCVVGPFRTPPSVSK